MKKQLILLSVFLMVLLFLCGCKQACDHVQTEWITDAEATCTAGGSKRQVCTACGETIATESIPTVGHTDGEWITDTEATCTANGNKHQICAVCGETIATESVQAGHIESDWIIDIEPTCVASGQQHKECTNCHIVLSITSIQPVDHQIVIIPMVEASCQKNGLTVGKICSICGAVIEEQLTIEKSNHIYELKTEVEPTLHSAGVQSETCTVCGYAKKTYIIAPLSDEYNCDLSLEELAYLTVKSLRTMACDTFEWNVESNTVDDYLYPYGELSTYIAIKQFVLELTKDDITERDKVYRIYKWICDNIVYSSTASYNSISETWEQKTGVCAQFVSLAHDMLSAAGIQSAYIGGYVYTGYGADPHELNTGTILRHYYDSGHAIITCYADGKILLFDPTWGQKLGDNYFDMSDDFLDAYFIPRDMNGVTVVSDDIDIRMYEGPMFKIGKYYFHTVSEYYEIANCNAACSSGVNAGVAWRYEYKSYEDARIGACYSSSNNTIGSTYYYLPDARAILKEDYIKYVYYEQLYFFHTITPQVELPYILHNGALYKKEGEELLVYSAQLDDAEIITVPSNINGKTVTAVYSIGENSNIKKVIIENGVQMVAGNWPNLEEISLPASVNSWQPFMYYYLETITVSEDNDTYKVIDNVLYSKDGSKLIYYPCGKKDTVFALPQGVKELNIKYCNQYLTEIIWNNDIEIIEQLNTPNIVNLIFPDSLLSINELSTDKLETLHISSKMQIAKSHYGTIANLLSDKSLRAVTVDSDNPYYQIIDGVLFSKDGKTLIRYFNYLTDDVYVIPDGTQTIGTFAFLANKNIKQVIMPASLSAFDKSVFSSASIESIDLTQIHSLNGTTFAGCNYLTYLILPVGMESIGAQEFYDSGIETLVIENQNMKVENTSFANCGGMKIFLAYNEITNKEQMWETYGCQIYTQDQWEYVNGKPALK